MTLPAFNRLVRGLVAAVAVAMSAGAAATEVAEKEVGYRVDVPADVRYSPELSAMIVRDFADTRRYRGVALRANGKAFADPARGIAIYVLWLTTDGKVVDPEGAVAGEIDTRRQRPAAAAPRGRVDVSKWAPEVSEKLVSVELEFVDKSGGLRTHLRSLMFLDGEGRIHEVNAECVVREDAGAETRAACDKAVASLEVTVPAEQRGAFAVAAPALAPARLAFDARPAEDGAGGAGAGGTGAADGTGAPAGAGEGGTTGATIGPAGDGKTLYVAPQKAARGSRRWMLYAGGLLLILTLIWFARKRREDTRSDDGGGGNGTPKGAA